MNTKWNLGLPRVLPIHIFLCFTLFYITSSQAQECPLLISPLDGATDVNLNTTISWEAILGVPGYVLSLGTTVGATDILNELNVGAATSYTAPLGLPENTEIFVTITLFFFNQPNIVCESQNFITAILTNPPDCTSLNNPANNATDTNIATNISWNFAPNATGYILSIGITQNGTEIINNEDVNNTLSYNPLLDLPPETDIYVTITPYNRIGTAINCDSFVFTTAANLPLPTCTKMITPFNGETNVPLSPFLEWEEIPNAKGYIVSIGSSPFESNILENAILFNNATNILDFEHNRTFFITIIPFNDAGEAIGCTQETFSTILGCGPFFDTKTGELTTLNPQLSIPDVISICLDKEENSITTTDNLDGFRWYKINLNGDETLISSSPEVKISAAGEYRYEAYNIIEDSGLTFECSSSKIFNVEVSELPVISNINVTRSVTGITIQTTIEGIGDYEYALDNKNGPYQSSNTFSNTSLDNHIIYVRDKNGCGIVEKLIEQDFTIEGFPNFFTPNGDGINDFWQFIPPAKKNDSSIISIFIFDRYGTLLAQVDPKSNGWEGIFNGKELPESDYWFKAISIENKEIKGYFSLKR